ncbi:SO2930 family diheme c-type cytochrome [Pollutibacter soli]|uniref:SO2930 family diheme c-type cytochrome n=1 Tax=Pollutibacter soli TaxID=3034157 RepID=UPI003013C22E
MKSRLLIFFSVILTSLCVGAAVDRPHPPKELLSQYGFFKGVLKDQQPADGIMPYSLSTPLFSDYAEKLRFVFIPVGLSAKFNDSSVFNFPEGTVLIKTFYFPVDFRNPSKGRRLMETRLLIHEGSRWIAYPYIWNEDQKDAVYDPAGEVKAVKYVDLNGKKKEHNYFIPNQNQCKGCHNQNEVLVPLGPSARQMNHDMMYSSGKQNQLLYWEQNDKLSGFKPSDAKNVGIVWNDPATGTLDQRARLWLDINCGFCHQPQGPAASSGLHLHMQESDPLRIGINKTPVAAGRGSGDRRFDIVPGKPVESILIFRMESDDPGIMMPELGRSVKHQEGIALIKEWIAGMK